MWDINGHSDQKEPLQISATHAISKIEQKSQNRIPRELDQKFGILDRHDSLSQFHFFQIKKSLIKKSYVNFLYRNSTYK